MTLSHSISSVSDVIQQLRNSKSVMQCSYRPKEVTQMTYRWLQCDTNICIHCMNVVALPSHLLQFNEESNILAYLYYFIRKDRFIVLKYPSVCSLITFEINDRKSRNLVQHHNIRSHHITVLYNSLLSLIPT